MVLVICSGDLLVTVKIFFKLKSEVLWNEVEYLIGYESGVKMGMYQRLRRQFYSAKL